MRLRAVPDPAAEPPQSVDEERGAQDTEVLSPSSPEIFGRVKTSWSGRREVQPGQELTAFSASEALAWSLALGKALPPGTFAEDLRISGPVDDGLIGEEWQLGEVRLLICGPADPRRVFCELLSQRRRLAFFTARNRVGLRLRVLEAGLISTDQEVKVARVLDEGISAHRWFAKRLPTDGAFLLELDRVGKIALDEQMRTEAYEAFQGGSA